MTRRIPRFPPSALAVAALLAPGVAGAQAASAPPGTAATPTTESVTTTARSSSGVVRIKTESTTGTTIAPLAAPAGAAPLASGIDRHGMDANVRPQDDLFFSMNGDWLRTTEIPADKSFWGVGTQLRDRSDAQVRGLVEGLVAKPGVPGSNASRLADFYRAYLGVDAIDRRGTNGVDPSLKAIDGLADPHELVAWMGRWQGMANVPLAVEVGPDFRAPGVYAATYGRPASACPIRIRLW